MVVAVVVDVEAVVGVVLVDTGYGMVAVVGVVMVNMKYCKVAVAILCWWIRVLVVWAWLLGC